VVLLPDRLKDDQIGGTRGEHHAEKKPAEAGFFVSACF